MILQVMLFSSKYFVLSMLRVEVMALLVQAPGTMLKGEAPPVVTSWFVAVYHLNVGSLVPLNSHFRDFSLTINAGHAVNTEKHFSALGNHSQCHIVEWLIKKYLNSYLKVSYCNYIDEELNYMTEKPVNNSSW